MKHGEAGFAAIEMVVAFAIVALIVSGAVTVTFRTIKDTQRTNDHMTVVRQAANAGYWISRDAQMADMMITDNLTAPEFLILKWTEWGYDQASVYHSATYSIEDVSGGIGKLKRTHEDSGGTNEQMLVAQYVYYSPGSENTTQVSRTGSTLNLKVVTSSGHAQEIKEYKTYCRPKY